MVRALKRVRKMHPKNKLNKIHREVAGSSLDPCVYCNLKATNADHITPKSQGGGNSVGNLAPTCYKCNRDKADTSILLALLHRKIRRRINHSRTEFEKQYRRESSKSAHSNSI